MTIYINIFDIERLNLWTTLEGHGCIRLNSNLVSRLALFGSFDPPLSHDQWGYKVYTPLGSPHSRATIESVNFHIYIYIYIY